MVLSRMYTRVLATGLPIWATNPSSRFILIHGPQQLRKRATKVKLRLATSVPARLQVRGQHFKLNRHVRTVKLRIPRGNGMLTLDLRLNSSGRRFRLTLRIPRK